MSTFDYLARRTPWQLHSNSLDLPAHVNKDNKFLVYEDKSDNWQR